MNMHYNHQLDNNHYAGLSFDPNELICPAGHTRMFVATIYK